MPYSYIFGVYAIASESFLNMLVFGLSGQCPASPKVSPFPSLPDMSPKKVSAAHNVYVSPLLTSKVLFSHQPFSFRDILHLILSFLKKKKKKNLVNLIWHADYNHKRSV